MSVRSISLLARSFGSVLALLLLATPASAATFWWNNSVDDDWHDGNNWSFDPGGAPGVPLEFFTSYITTSPLHFPNPQDPAVVDEPAAVSGKLYIGGYKASEFHHHHGFPAGTTGALEITTGGHLEISPKDTPPNAPWCHYVRLGYAGGIGRVHQDDGDFRSCGNVTIGQWSPDTVGTWEMTGGEAQAHGWDVGVQGVGMVLQSGGTMDIPRTLNDRLINPQDYYPDTDGDGVGDYPAGLPLTPGEHYGGTNVGAGYYNDDVDEEPAPVGEDPPPDYAPGVGFMNLTGGNFTTGELRVGNGTGAAGLVTIRGDAHVQSLDRMHVGLFGAGSVVQTGGLLETPRIDLSRWRGGLGQYTISGGQLHVKVVDPPAPTFQMGFFNGSVDADQNGIGSFTVVGARSNYYNGILIEGLYQQNATSRLTYVLEEAAPYVTPIWADDVKFLDGAMLFIKTVDPSVAPPACSPVNLMATGGTLTVQSSLTALLEGSPGWTLAIQTGNYWPWGYLEVLQATYDDGSCP